jgi:hypothetical protein
MQRKWIGKVSTVENLQSALEGVNTSLGADGVDERFRSDHLYRYPTFCGEPTDSWDGELPHRRTAGDRKNNRTFVVIAHDPGGKLIIYRLEVVLRFVKVIAGHDVPGRGELG